MDEIKMLFYFEVTKKVRNLIWDSVQHNVLSLVTSLLRIQVVILNDSLISEPIKDAVEEYYDG